MKNYSPVLCSLCNTFQESYSKVDNEYICSSCYDKFLRPRKECSICSEVNKVSKLIDGKPICPKCYNKYYRIKTNCFSCGIACYSVKNVEGKPICSKCYEKNYRPVKLCSCCGENGITAKIVDGKNICQSCYNKYYYSKDICAICGKEKRVAKRISNNAICYACYNKYYRPKKVCSNCGNIGIIEKTIDGRLICRSCYEKYYKRKGYCSICNKYAIIKNEEDNQRLCAACYNRLKRPKQICSICDKLDIAEKKINDKFVCPSCYRKYYQDRRICSICGTTNIVTKTIGELNICPSCYNKSYRPKKVCSICGFEGPINKIDGDLYICNSCYYKAEGFCKNCRKVSKAVYYFRGFCRSCWFNLKSLNFLHYLKGIIGDKTIYSCFVKYAEVIKEYRSSTNYYLNLIHQSELYTFLDIKKINIENITIEDIQILKQHFHSSIIQQFSNFMLKEGILVPLTSIQEFNIFRARYIKMLTPCFSVVLEKYTDYLITICENYKKRGWDNRLSYSTCCDYTYVCFRFLSFISDRVSSTKEITDQLVDEFLSNYAYATSHLRQFIQWLNKSYRLFKKIALPKCSTKHVGDDPYSDEELICILDSLLAPDIPYRDKVVGLLNIFYAVRPNEMCKFKIGDYIKENGCSYIFVRNKKIIIVPFISHILDMYISNERSSSLSIGTSEEWLLPGSKYNSSLSSQSIGLILRKHNINSHKSFSTAILNALIQNAGNPAVIMNGLSLNISTVMGYYKEFGLDNIDTAKVNDSTANYIHEDLSQDTKAQGVFYVYIIKCNDGSYYTGYTSNLNERIERHKNGYGCRYTSTRIPIELVYYEELSNKSSALKREKQIKKLTIFEKEQLIIKSRVN